MNDSLTALLLFITAVVVQAALHRVFLKFQVRTLRTYLVYPDVLLLSSISITPFLSMEAIVMYILLSLLAVILFITPILGDKPPTSRILALLSKKKTASYAQMASLITDKDAILKRLDDEVSWKLVIQDGNRYRVTIPGAILAFCERWYLRLLQWTPSV